MNKCTICILIFGLSAAIGSIIWNLGFNQGLKQGFRACEELKEKEKE